MNMEYIRDIYICIFLIYSPNIFHIFPLVCFLIYSVNSRSGHDRSPTFGSISHVSGPKLTFWNNFQMIMHGFAWRNSKNIVFSYQTTVYLVKKRIWTLKSHGFSSESVVHGSGFDIASGVTKHICKPKSLGYNACMILMVQGFPAQQAQRQGP